jgi:hypothetical protein
MSPWVYDPHSGGVKIPKTVQEETRKRLEAHAAKRYAGKYTRLDLRFRGQFCYIGAYTEDFTDHPVQMCRLRYFRHDHWSVAFFTYSNERYEPCLLASGEDDGTPEEGFDVGAVYLSDEGP